jgi:hypothetical protein
MFSALTAHISFVPVLVLVLLLLLLLLLLQLVLLPKNVSFDEQRVRRIKSCSVFRMFLPQHFGRRNKL